MQPLYSKGLRRHTHILPATSQLEFKVSFPISAAGLKPGTTPDSRHPAGIRPIPLKDKAGSCEDGSSLFHRQLLSS